MKTRADRRRFLKNLGMGGVGTGLLSAEMSCAPNERKGIAENNKPIGERSTRAYNGKYSDDYLKRIAMPIGGMGAGMFCLEGAGAISHVSVRNKPDIFNEPGMFAAISIKGMDKGAKVLEGPVPDWKKFGLRDAGNGLGGAITGLPHFKKATFETRFPFAGIELEDDDLPLKVQITGWSPFIPGDDDNSSLPIGAIEYKLKNTGPGAVEAVFSFNSKNFLKVDKGTNTVKPITNGFVLSEAGTKEEPSKKCDFALFTNDAATVVDHCWFRGGWWDPLTIAWNTIKNAEVRPVKPVESGAPGASLYVPFSLAAGQEKTIKVMMAWYSPDSDQSFGKMGIRAEDCLPEDGCADSPDELDKYDKNFDAKFFKPWYSSRFSSVNEVSSYWKDNYDGLYRKSDLFTKAFYASTLPPEVVEAVAANLSILKSPTVQRQFDGRLWNFEGCGDSWGCCHGSCTHVWNYAQAIPHLFPALERSLRHTEFFENQNAQGHQNFRATSPIRVNDHNFHAAADGQLGGIMKVYREWRISGDNVWVGKMFPLVKSSMDFCIRTWDPSEKGILEEPHHNTYDIEFWGPDGMHMSFYVGALNALVAMGKFLGKDVGKYEQLAGQGKAFMESELYDGEYFIQKIKVDGLKAPNPIEASAISMGGQYSDEARQLLEEEGPKYQYGNGCLSDGVLGAWIARVCGLDDPIDPGKLKSHLLAVHKYNLKDNLSDHANPQRPTFALGNDGGLLLCSWPKGGKLSLPFVYSDEVWTGIEYQVAAHLMEMGAVEEGLEIVRTCRDRYDGRVRNPFNEYECGSWYARALSSYGMLQGLTGVRYDAVDKTLYVDSRIGDFTSFLSTENGFGTVTLKGGQPSLDVVYGEISVDKVMVSGKELTLA
ncbi:GH116 family glycosyl hydrolase [Imperialibacter roseus]|uniref:GH116 family glycosyl hydrolase n=1 Tax=Imperialibacter roseus TaxID=1324217 RepID=A0ABZ0IPR8_9BACT|nr:GH116 family glycosyl hydrolase [Imperialibacter roseus]WOK07037.1 GH116 family glycosyl hydrolase [Imperialibacter roseus]